MKALITGFEAWARSINPGGMIVNQMNGSKVDGVEIIGVELPEDFYAIPKLAKQVFKKYLPNIVISLGWDYTHTVRVERIALNVMSSIFGGKVVPDNKGNTPKDEPVVKGAPLALRSTLPVDQIVEALAKVNIPVSGSFHAGTHCCNATMYSFLQATRSHSDTISGFIHVPPIPEMLKEIHKSDKSSSIFTLPLSTEKLAVEVAVKECKRYLTAKRSA
jgi:pyroglutamyl-peptidase